MAIKTPQELRDQARSLPVPRSFAAVKVWAIFFIDLIDTFSGTVESNTAPAEPAAADLGAEADPLDGLIG